VLVEGLLALAAATGGAVVQAAGTDAWNAVRGGIARVLGRGEEAREQRELERLEQTRAVLDAATEGQAEQVRAAQAAVWQSRLELLLEELPEVQRQQVAAELQAVIEQAGAAAERQPVHNDFSGSTFEKSAVQGSGTQHNTFN
jgi:flagellar biosynthesis regulator FlaF